MSVADVLAAVYVAGVVVATVSGWVVALRLGDQDQPAAHLVLWSVVAGVLWPVTVVGIVELVGVWMFAKALARGQARDPDPLCAVCDCDALPRHTDTLVATRTVHVRAEAIDRLDPFG
jgi:hypothetical protein